MKSKMDIEYFQRRENEYYKNYVDSLEKYRQEKAKTMNTTPKRYELLKDLPNMKTGRLIEWDGIYYSCMDDMGEYFKLIPEAVENNPLWFREIKENKEFVWTDDLVLDFALDVVEKNGKVSIVDFKTSKQRFNHKCYSEYELEQAEKKAFEAAREKPTPHYNSPEFFYPTFEAYKNFKS